MGREWGIRLGLGEKCSVSSFYRAKPGTLIDIDYIYLFRISKLYLVEHSLLSHCAHKQ
jgi:hypothetical protein